MEATVTRLDRWERRTSGPLTFLAVLFIAAYALPVLRPDLPGIVVRTAEICDVVIWALLGADYAIRLALSRDRRAFVRTHLFDLAVLLLPVLRPLRVLRVVNAMVVLNRRADIWTRGRLSLHVGCTTVLLVIVAALAVLDAERGHPGGVIDDFPRALWWAVVTITTVGYGDFYPVTVSGRVVALALMVGGIGLIGFVTGSLASWIVERISTAERPQEATKDDIAELTREIVQLRAEVAELSGKVLQRQSPGTGTGTP